MRLRKQIKELETRIWKLENPPKEIGSNVELKEGDKKVVYTVVHVEFKDSVNSLFHWEPKRWVYTLYCCKTKKQRTRVL